MSDTYEELIGLAILGDEQEKEKQLIRVECKLQASHRMFCQCGSIFDQKTIEILRDEAGETRAVCCPSCKEKAQQQFAGHSLPGWTFANWNRTEPAIPPAVRATNDELVKELLNDPGNE